MTCHELAKRLSELKPELSAIDVARLCLMILSQTEGDDLRDDAELLSAWQHASFRLEAASDQHAAVADELAAACDDNPHGFNQDQLWILLRAVKVQSQVLELYTAETTAVL